MYGYWESAEGAQEIVALELRFPKLSMQRHADRRRFVISGVIEISNAVGYAVSLILPQNYPKDIPVLFCDPDEIPRSADRHFFTDTGAACLCAMSEYRIHWPYGSGIVAFIEKLVIPFLTAQYYFQTYGIWPPTGQRTHGPKGILEAYADIAAPLGNATVATIRRLMIYLARKTQPKGHEICPCGSQLILRKCHASTLRRLRMQVQPEHARTDLLYLANQKMPPFFPLPAHF